MAACHAECLGTRIGPVARRYRLVPRYPSLGADFKAVAACRRSRIGPVANRWGLVTPPAPLGADFKVVALLQNRRHCEEPAGDEAIFLFHSWLAFNDILGNYQQSLAGGN